MLILMYHILIALHLDLKMAHFTLKNIEDHLDVKPFLVNFI